MSARWSAEDMGLEVQDAGFSSVDPILEEYELEEPLQDCPECGRASVIEAGFEGYDPRTHSRKVLCAWCGWVTV